MFTRKVRLAAGGSLAALALAGAAMLAVPTKLVAAEEGRNEGIPAQREAASAAAPAKGVLFAVVASNAKLVRDKGASNVKEGRVVGDYVVTFDDDVSDCAYVATIGITGDTGVADPGFITVARSNSSNRAVYVSTYNLNAFSSRRPFHLVVTCS
jgi:hypothetical protein